MPVQIIESSDPISACMQFRTSAVYEMLVSLHTLSVGRRHTEWIASARSALGADFIAELTLANEALCQGTSLFEMAVDYTDHEDVPGFIEYVQTMESDSFVFYLIGRVLTRDQIRTLPTDPDQIIQIVRDAYPPTFSAITPALRQAFVDVPTFQAQLVSLWQRYWDRFFHGQVAGLRTRWLDAIAEKERLLAHYGGKGLLEAVTGKTHLFRELPFGHPITEVILIPTYFASAQSYVFFGYGNQTILFDSELTEARRFEINQNKQTALDIAKSLSDSTRLNILHLIVQSNDAVHGKRIAHKLNLSPSAVSRQLAQLRDSGLIVETPHDDQTVTYQLVEDAITSLPGKILDYLYS